ncbi:MAG: histidine kinase [Labilithrix sp.]|jgi:DNA-binding NtrC family response regulator|nr:histidine kinase [Labilithrix sp.]
MNILLVDDEEDSCSMLAGMLRREGYAVDGCANAELALARLRTTSYDVMMTDQSMPGMNGTDLVIAARLVQSGLRCIIATGHNAPAESLRGDATWLTKPLDVDALVALLGPATAS